VRYATDLNDPTVAELAVRDVDDCVRRADLLLSHLRWLSVAAEQAIGAKGNLAANRLRSGCADAA